MQRRERVGEVDVAFNDAGQGPALILLPPFPFDHRVWADNIPALLAADRRVIALDYPGFGASPPPTAALSISGLADLVAGLLDVLKIPSAVVVGLSMGGYVALAFAARFGNRLDALVLADTRAAADAPAARQARAAALATINDKGVEEYLAQSVPKLLAAGSSAAVVARAQGLAERRAASLAAAIVALRDREDRTAQLASIDRPTLVLVGEADTVTPPTESRAVAAAIKGASFVVIPGAGHLSNLEVPGEFNGALLEFLRGVPDAPVGSEQA